MATPLTTGIDWGTEIASDPITYYFAAASDAPFDGVTPTTWTAYEIQQFERAFAIYESFLAVTFAAVDDLGDTPDLILVRGDDLSPAMDGILGFFNPPGETNEGIGAFNADGLGWDWDAPGSGGLEQGGDGFVTILHELGHGLGLAHPHDDGGTSTVFPGVSSPFNSYGLHQLNQGVFTMMSYNSGWPKNPEGAPAEGANFGFEGTPMAIDIAVLQAKYGANLGYHTGDDTYVLPKANGLGAFYLCIWDAGGSDTLVHDGSAAAIIDLRAATLAVEEGGGGFISYVRGLYGGFTIANGVVIENASGGSGNDTLTGNAVANILDGRGGADTLRGLGGDDTYFVDHTGDVVDESVAASGGVDSVFATVSFDLGDGVHAKGSVENLTLLDGAALDAIGNGLANTLVGNANGNLLDGKSGADVLRGLGGDDRYVVDDARDVVDEGAAGSGGRDLVRAAVSFDLREGTEVRGAVEDLTLTGNASIDGTGNALANTIKGNRGDNVLDGGLGRDVLKGGHGRDSFVFDFPASSKGDAARHKDKILDFAHRDDRILLTAAVFTDLDAGKLAKKDFASGLKTPGKDGHLVYWHEKSGKLYYDLDGRGTKGGDIEIARLNKDADLAANDFLVV